MTAMDGTVTLVNVNIQESDGQIHGGARELLHLDPKMLSSRRLLAKYARDTFQKLERSLDRSVTANIPNRGVWDPSYHVLQLSLDTHPSAVNSWTSEKSSSDVVITDYNFPFAMKYLDNAKSQGPVLNVLIAPNGDKDGFLTGGGEDEGVHVNGSGRY